MPTMAQIEARIAKLQAQAEVVRAKQSTVVISRIVKLMSDNGITIADIDAAIKPVPKRGRPSLKVVGAPAKRGRPRGSNNKPAGAAKKSVLPAKYRNPKTGETWSGWARPPEWIAKVKDRTKFLIDPNDNGTIAINRKKPAAKRITAKAA